MPYNDGEMASGSLTPPSSARLLVSCGAAIDSRRCFLNVLGSNMIFEKEV